MGIQVEKERIILYKHTCKYELIKAIALDVKNNCNSDISDEEKYRMQERLTQIGLYKTRNSKDKPLDAMNHRINTLQYWMFGYKQKLNHENKFIFSPLGNLFIRNIQDEKKLKKIYTTMLFGMQFPHSGSHTPTCFNIYFFRLIFKLLIDPRLDGKLYNQEYECLLAFTKEINEKKYENLVLKILEMRKLSDEELVKMLKADEHTYVNNVHEWETFIQTLLEQVEIIKKVKGQLLCRLYHPQRNNSKSTPTARLATRGYIYLNPDLLSFVKLLLNNYKFDEKPLKLSDNERLEMDVIKEIYSFYPKELLEDIGEFNPIINDLLNLTKLIEKYSNNENCGDCYLFEEVLTKGFNQFYNIDAELCGGAGSTDIECLYLHPTTRKKFAVDAKSTGKKLTNINAGRLASHRRKISGDYTIVITPRYVPAVKQDILGNPIVIILASTFSEFLYNCISHGIRKIDYVDFDDIIVNNLGRDISNEISNLTIERFGASL